MVADKRQLQQERSNDLARLLQQAVEALGSGGPALAGPANELAQLVNRPMRVAIIGRLKSGKSTLVNALTETHIAATGSLECTMAVSVYEEGAPARAEVVGLDEATETIPLTGGVLKELPRPLDEVDFVRQFVPIARLRTLGIIDTPGTATLTVENEARTRRTLIDGAKDTKRASSWADGVVFLSDSAPRDDERTFLADLQMTPLTTIGVVSRADSFGAGAFGPVDPLQQAATYAGRIAQQLKGSVGVMVPLSGLLAESALTGRVRGETVRQLAALAPLDRATLLDFIEVGDPSRVVEGFSAAERDELLDVVGEYGLMYGRRAAAEGGPTGLMEWMRQTSGIDRLTEIITQDMPYYAMLQRAVRVVDVLEDLESNPAARDHVRWVMSVLLSQPAMERVLLYRSFIRTVASSPDSQLVPRISAAIQATIPAETAGVDPSAPPQAVQEALRRELGVMRELAMTPLSAAEDEARERLIVAYQAAWKQLGA
ncbi:dynamin family protein [Corynebacterium aquatimens]|uniref:Signal recognition particle receptor subunit beta n=1 Tax=Corynebacterium aquatimens TaxID=1190508 RepID=A0A931E0P9_9CORY|nr:dynamin family protein [Corynebacterium aquatimens]MBG6122138.1 signal recognition particle receptor subunit beta [Corynebacterium aquatimens]WJY65321.1 Isoniazid-induced protein IniC [Corynebacterium aquatimens]